MVSARFETSALSTHFRRYDYVNPLVIIVVIVIMTIILEPGSSVNTVTGYELYGRGVTVVRSV
jgi:hypothetical protein